MTTTDHEDAITKLYLEIESPFKEKLDALELSKKACEAQIREIKKEIKRQVSKAITRATLKVNKPKSTDWQKAERDFSEDREA